MAELQVFKAKINNACTLIKAIEADIKRLDEPFAFPEGRSECEHFVRTKIGEMAHLLNTLQNATKMQEAQISAALNHIAGRHEQKEREKLMTELNKHLEVESHQLELTAAQWQNKIQFRQHELREQSNVLHCTIPSISNQSVSGSDGTATSIPERDERQLRIRKPALEIPSFSGNFREFNTFWTVFESLIHNDEELSNIDKFLFLKQALKGRAAVAISCIPVVGERYHAAVNIQKKQFDRSANMADIIINEIERLQRASENPRSCRETFEAINARIIHLEQTGMTMNADRIWRRLILSKFPKVICTMVIQKESQSDHSFDVTEIMSTIDAIISLRETTALTTETLFVKDNNRTNLPRPTVNKSKWDEGMNMPRRKKGMCLCGQPHSPHSCPKFTTPQARRVEVRKQRACWRCFARSHQSKDCTAMGLCPRCNEGHHSSLCLSDTRRQDTGYIALPRQQRRNMQLPPAARSQQPPVDRSHHHQHDNRSVQIMHNSQNGRHVLTMDRTAMVSDQCVLQTATAMIFNEAEWDYQPITLLLDTGAQKSFIKTGISEDLKLRILGSTSFTTSGMGEIQEAFNSNEVQITLKGLHSPEKLENLSVQTKQKLTTPLTTAELSEADLNFISSSSITVAQQSLGKTTVSPDLLIGQDLLSTIIDHNRPVLTLPSGLILTPTVLGYTISGTSLTTKKVTAVEAHGNALDVSATLVISKDDRKRDISIAHMSGSARLQTENNGDESIMEVSKDYKGGPDYCTASQLLIDHGSRFALLQVEKPAERFRTIWNSDYLEFQDQRRLDEGYRDSTRSKKEVTPKAKKILEKKPPKKKKESSTKCVWSTLTITPASSDAATRMCDQLPVLQQRHGMRNRWLYRHWLFTEKSHLSDSRPASKRRLSTCTTTRTLDTSSASRYRHGR
ncbi:hypothetical protein Y032_0019g3883 [Ancylostoma ceylanicum]|uniref:Peptidase A2 domain-containing protein n=1 Tax=Ancylostoma ceylanicum TaxID=53326 RepID=A0A016V3J3_9BILA|nr:hypothetical protein Y032_0019g3883 [Ancylostoma ceylanicum]